MIFFKGNSLAIVGFIIISIILFVAIFAHFLSPYDPNYIDINSILLPPSLDHLMGTDGLGRDVLSRMLYGARISLFVGFVAVGIATLIGIILGSIAGFYGGWLDSVIMRLVDIMLSIPTFFLILAVIAFLTPSIWNIMIVINFSCNRISNPFNLEYHDRYWPYLLDGSYQAGKGRIFKFKAERLCACFNCYGHKQWKDHHKTSSSK